MKLGPVAISMKTLNRALSVNVLWFILPLACAGMLVWAGLEYFAISSTEIVAERWPDVFLIPQNYVGSIRVDYGIPGTPPLPIRNGCYIYKIPSSGYLRTSSALPEDGLAKDEYYYVGAKQNILLDASGGKSSLVWGDTFISGSDNGMPVSTYRWLFVGTEKVVSFSSVYRHMGRLNPTAVNARFKGQNLSDSDYKGRDFSRRNLVGANLTNSGFEKANLRSANLMYALLAAGMSFADLRCANLRETDIVEGTWEGTDCRGADLRGARILGVDLHSAKLAGANLQDAIYTKETKWPKGFDPKKHGAKMISSQPPSF
jgi:hypothetical protein